MPMFTELIEELRNIEGIDYSLIAPTVDKIINNHEEMERANYDLEGDLKERDDYIAKVKESRWDDMRKRESDSKEEKEDEKTDEDDEEKIVEIEDMLDTPKEDKEEED